VLSGILFYFTGPDRVVQSEWNLLFKTQDLLDPSERAKFSDYFELTKTGSSNSNRKKLGGRSQGRSFDITELDSNRYLVYNWLKGFMFWFKIELKVNESNQCTAVDFSFDIRRRA
jgi:hypothetical protein